MSSSKLVKTMEVKEYTGVQIRVALEQGIPAIAYLTLTGRVKDNWQRALGFTGTGGYLSLRAESSRMLQDQWPDIEPEDKEDCVELGLDTLATVLCLFKDDFDLLRSFIEGKYEGRVLALYQDIGVVTGMLAGVSLLIASAPYVRTKSKQEFPYGIPSTYFWNARKVLHNFVLSFYKLFVRTVVEEGYVPDMERNVVGMMILEDSSLFDLVGTFAQEWSSEGREYILGCIRKDRHKGAYERTTISFGGLESLDEKWAEVQFADRRSHWSYQHMMDGPADYLSWNVLSGVHLSHLDFNSPILASFDEAYAISTLFSVQRYTDNQEKYPLKSSLLKQIMYDEWLATNEFRPQESLVYVRCNDAERELLRTGDWVVPIAMFTDFVPIQVKYLRLNGNEEKRWIHKPTIRAVESFYVACNLYLREDRTNIKPRSPEKLHRKYTKGWEEWANNLKSLQNFSAYPYPHHRREWSQVLSIEDQRKRNSKLCHRQHKLLGKPSFPEDMFRMYQIKIEGPLIKKWKHFFDRPGFKRVRPETKWSTDAACVEYLKDCDPQAEPKEPIRETQNLPRSHPTGAIPKIKKGNSAKRLNKKERKEEEEAKRRREEDDRRREDREARLKEREAKKPEIKKREERNFSLLMAESPDHPSPRSKALKEYWGLGKRAMALKAYWGPYYDTTNTPEEKVKLRSSRKKEKQNKGDTIYSPNTSTNMAYQVSTDLAHLLLVADDLEINISEVLDANTGIFEAFSANMVEIVLRRYRSIDKCIEVLTNMLQNASIGSVGIFDLFSSGAERDKNERGKLMRGEVNSDNPETKQSPQDMELTTEELKRTEVQMRFSSHKEGGGIHYIQSFESMEKLVEDATEPGEGGGKVAVLSMKLQPQAAWVFNQFILPELEQDTEQIIIEIIKEDDGSARM